MRLLFLNPTASMGGAERVLLDLLGVIRQAEPTWCLGLIVGNEGTLAEEARKLGVTTVVMPFPREFARIGDAGLQGPRAWLTFVRHALAGSFSMAAYLRRFHRQIEHFSPTVIHSNGFKMHLLAALAKPAGVPLIWHFHDYLSSRRVASRLVFRLRSRCSAIVAVSDSVAEDIRRHVGAYPPVCTVWNAVDLKRFAPSGRTADLDTLAGLPLPKAGVVRVGLVATFARWKGHLLFLDAVRSLLDQYNIRAYIVGGPLYETEGSQYTMETLRAAIDARGMKDTVGLTGFVRDSDMALRALDVVVHSSTSPEPFGLVIAEAMATGRSVVVSQAGGVSELVTHDSTALTYPQGNCQALAQQVERLVADASLRQRLGAAAHCSALSQFSPQRVGQQMLALYAKVGAVGV